MFLSRIGTKNIVNTVNTVNIYLKNIANTRVFGVIIFYKLVYTGREQMKIFLKNIQKPIDFFNFMCYNIVTKLRKR